MNFEHLKKFHVIELFPSNPVSTYEDSLFVVSMPIIVPLEKSDLLTPTLLVWGFLLSGVNFPELYQGQRSKEKITSPTGNLPLVNLTSGKQTESARTQHLTENLARFG